MKKKNGFISMSVIFAFFIMLLMILVGIVALYSSDRILLRKSRNAIKESLVEKLETKGHRYTGYIDTNNKGIYYI